MSLIKSDVSKQVLNEGVLTALTVGAFKLFGCGRKKKEKKEKINFFKPVRRYNYPENTLLDHISNLSNDVVDRSDEVQTILVDHKIKGKVVNFITGARLTTYAVKLDAGVKPNVINKISDSLKVNLMVSSVRIVTPIPNTPHIGIEIPNSNNNIIHFVSNVNSLYGKDMRLPINLGVKATCGKKIIDLADAPHLLIAGATGSGKSVCMHTIIMSMIYKYSPNDLQMIMIDPKRVEFNAYNNIPHLLAPVITEADKASEVLEWVVGEMERRYEILQNAKCRSIITYNQQKSKHMPYMVVIIDELADLMMTGEKKVVEKNIARIAQLARAVGIHLVVATQRPSTDVITGIIKANFPTRIAFQVASNVDSRVILDTKGAEDLLGKGDMIIKTSSDIERVQGCFLSDDEIDRVVNYIT